MRSKRLIVRTSEPRRAFLALNLQLGCRLLIGPFSGPHSRSSPLPSPHLRLNTRFIGIVLWDPNFLCNRLGPRGISSHDAAFLSVDPVVFFIFKSDTTTLPNLQFIHISYVISTYLAYKAFHIGPTFVTSRSVSSALFHSIYVATRGHLSARLPFATLSVRFFDSLRFVYCLSTQIPI